MMVQFDPQDPDDLAIVQFILDAQQVRAKKTAQALQARAKRKQTTAAAFEAELAANKADAIEAEMATRPDWSVPDVRPGRKRPKSAPPVGDREAWFAQFWGVVHAKIKRKKAEEAFRRAVDRVAKRAEQPRAEAAAFITERMAAYAKTPAGQPTDRSPTHPSTWLNGSQFEDDPKTWDQENGVRPTERKLQL